MKKIFNYVCMFALLCGSAMFTACSDDNGGSDDLTAVEQSIKSMTRNYLNTVVYPTYSDLASASSDLYEQLKDVLAAYRAGTLTQSKIDKVCTTFLKARSYWEESEAFLYGPATSFGIDPHIDTWPLDLDALATSLSNSDQVAMLEGEDGITYAGAKLGQELLGFHGIEFIIFRDGANRTVSALNNNETDAAFAKYTVTGEQELVYATAVAGDLRDRCYQLEVSWMGEDAPSSHVARVEECEYETILMASDYYYGDDMLHAKEAGSTFSTWQKVLVTIFNGGCSNICNEVANSKMGLAYTGEDPNYIESPYSKKSFYDFYDNIISIKNTLYGGRNLSTPASGSILAYMNENANSRAVGLSSTLDAALDALQDCIDSGVAFVDNPKADLVKAAMDKINALDEQLQYAASWASTLY